MNAPWRQRPEPSLAARLEAARGTPVLYATTPPRLGQDLAAEAEKLAGRLDGLPVDGIAVYDLQDESARTAAPRPFPFVAHADPRAYAHLAAELTGREVVCYKCVGPMDEAAWRRWLDETAASHVRLLSLVGRPTSHGAQGGLSLERALELTRAHPARFMLGGVAIAERHAAGRSEADRMLAKASSGCCFYITQTVYDAQRSILLLRDYDRACRARGVSPRRVLLNFAPCGGPRTVQFMQWLGVAFAPGAAQALVDSPAPLAVSIALCRENLRRILAAAPASVPLGVAVESVSTRREEQQACAELLYALRKEIILRRGG